MWYIKASLAPGRNLISPSSSKVHVQYPYLIIVIVFFALIMRFLYLLAAFPVPFALSLSYRSYGSDVSSESSPSDAESQVDQPDTGDLPPEWLTASVPSGDGQEVIPQTYDDGEASQTNNPPESPQNDENLVATLGESSPQLNTPGTQFSDTEYQLARQTLRKEFRCGQTSNKDLCKNNDPFIMANGALRQCTDDTEMTLCCSGEEIYGADHLIDGCTYHGNHICICLSPPNFFHSLLQNRYTLTTPAPNFMEVNHLFISG